VKLLACLGAWVGPQEALWMALYAMLAGGVMAVGVSLASGYARKAISNVWMLLQYWTVMGVKPLPELTLATAQGPRLPYAIPIAAGAVAAIWMQ
jgi:prepilin peptidase CpaA